MKTFLVALFAISLTGCASAGADYYQAMERAANANAAASTARYEALAKVAQSNDPGAATAAVMAIALSKEAPVLPQYVESTALKWASVLVPGATTLGGIYLQTDLAKQQSDNSRDIQLASFDANTAVQLGQQGMVTNLGSQWSETATASAVAGGEAAITLGLAGFNALNTAGGQTVSVATTGFETADSIATTGMVTTAAVATTGMNGMETLGIGGMNAISAVSLAGMDSIETVGLAGMTNLTTLGTTGMALVDSTGNNYASIIADMQSTINQLGGDLADPITCSPNEAGLFVCQ